MEKTELYQWQEECLKKWLSNHGRGMVQAATGTGKTILALAAAERLERILDRELRIKIVVPSGALLRQWNRALRERLVTVAPASAPGTDVGSTPARKTDAGSAPGTDVGSAPARKIDDGSIAAQETSASSAAAPKAVVPN